MIPWSDEQRGRVVEALDAHPADSARCAQAAQAILPVAVEVDNGARGLVIEPAGLYVLVRNRSIRWTHHVTVAVAEHHVDALTGADGHPAAEYLAAYFDHPGDHLVRPINADEWEFL